MIEPVDQRWESANPRLVPANAFSSYASEEVTFLVKDVSCALVEVSRADYEEKIDQGRHYAEMLPEEEYHPSPAALDLFERTLHRSARRLARAVGITTETVLARKGDGAVLVSLCQTGTPIGILLRRWAAWRHGLTLPHYTISVVRGHGVDNNALSHIFDRHDPTAIPHRNPVRRWMDRQGRYRP